MTLNRQYVTASYTTSVYIYCLYCLHQIVDSLPTITMTESQRFNDGFNEQKMADFVRPKILIFGDAGSDRFVTLKNVQDDLGEKLQRINGMMFEFEYTP